ncbi:MAG: preprotein translocase subunit SecA, partial [Candidatus Poribacteria bacterium]|nr:preprotein translocase subunit SecA [Candidatus Poribacteria bacterium]
MKTGEGKTLVSTLPAYLNGLTGKGVHVITPNYYLAQRDSEWMGGIHRFLGLEVGLNLNDMSLEDKKKAYNSDITYGVNDAFGFDYLRDNLAIHPDHRVQRELNFAIVDEVDFILIDEARTPLIISGRSDKSAELYYTVNRIVPRLIRDVHYTIDDRNTSKGTVVLTEDGVTHVEKLLNVSNLYDPANIGLVHHVQQALAAHTLYKRDVDYVVEQGKIVIVDEFTGRLQPGRRWSDGLHQAVESKEGVKIEEENLSTARITYQNYFRLYNKLAGMTGTAETESAEFGEIYKLDVAVIPTNKPMSRTDYPDVIYKTEKEKFDAIIDEIVEMQKIGRPVLVGTRSIDTSERLSRHLKQQHVMHHVLNAKYHDKEAEIISHAGELKAVVIATNMAGRGVDIALGEGVKELGGLHIVGTERHESRRIDNQLRGRCGRQGDPGSSRFYLSLEDELMQRFGSERLASTMDWLGVQEGTPIEHPWISKAIENAQKKVEEHNFEIRKHIIKYDDVRNTQRTVIYEERNKVLNGQNLKEEILEMLDDVVSDKLNAYIGERLDRSDWDIPGLVDWLRKSFLVDISRWMPKPDDMSYDEIVEKLLKTLHDIYEERENQMGPDIMRQLERLVMLDRIDDHWIENLYDMDYLEDGIGFVAYGQKDPLVEFKRESHAMFSDMIQAVKDEVVEYMFKVRLASESDQQQQQQPRSRSHGQRKSAGGNAEPVNEPIHIPDKPGRNDLCPCGSGKKYKKCHGRNEQ